MHYLIDTHVCLWAIVNRDQLSRKVKQILENNDNEVWVSQISFFELAIKIQTGKLTEIDTPLSVFIESVISSGFEIMPFKNAPVYSYSSFNFFDEHRDPFDRYFIATAEAEKMDFITVDKKFQLYTDKVNIVW